jgi:hypothetical protein
MDHDRTGPKLLPAKLLKLREHLNDNASEMALRLETEIKSQDKECPVNARHVLEYEQGHSVPALLVVLAYSYVGEVSMMSLGDDNITVDEFCRQLGTYQRPTRPQK